MATGGMGILAMGPPCQANRAWHGCEPALTIVPTFVVASVLTSILALIVLLWTAVRVHRKHGGLLLMLLSLLLLLVGGGSIPRSWH